MELMQTIGELEDALVKWCEDNSVDLCATADRKLLLRAAFPPREFAKREETVESAGLAPSATLFASPHGFPLSEPKQDRRTKPDAFKGIGVGCRIEALVEALSVCVHSTRHFGSSALSRLSQALLSYFKRLLGPEVPFNIDAAKQLQQCGRGSQDVPVFWQSGRRRGGTPWKYIGWLGLCCTRQHCIQKGFVIVKGSLIKGGGVLANKARLLGTEMMPSLKSAMQTVCQRAH
eukprot:73896-Amphidinium_carterae.1